VLLTSTNIRRSPFAAPPAKEDGPILAGMATIGIEPGKPFDITKLDSATQAALKDTGKIGMQRIEAKRGNAGRTENAWNVTVGFGVYGTDYLKRATAYHEGLVMRSRQWPSVR
jgi:hypothetical protein